MGGQAVDDGCCDIEVLSAAQLIPGYPRKERFEHLTLPNGIRILHAATDHIGPHPNQVALTVSVEGGLFADPPTLPGLAHLVEHMIFLGSKRYPEEQGLREMCMRYQGQTMAVTTNHNLAISVEVPLPALREALDRIGDMLHAPLFHPSLLQREVLKIHEEHEENLQSEKFRLWQLTRDLANPNHLLNGFGTGSLATLGNVPNLRDHLQQWVRLYHVGGNITVAIHTSRQGLTPEEVEAIALETLLCIPPGHSVSPVRTAPPFAKEQLRCIVKCAPLTPTRQLKFVFPYPIGTRNYHTQTLRYISHFLGQTVEGSLLDRLKEAGRATGGWAGVEHEGTNWGILVIAVDLTEAGDTPAGIEDIAVKVFQTCYLLRARLQDEALWKDVKLLHDVDFVLTEEQDAVEWARETANRMHVSSPEHSVIAGKVFLRYSAAEVRLGLEGLSPDNLLLFHITPEGCEDLPLRGAWGYRTPYDVQRIEGDVVSRWKSRLFPLDGKLRLTPPCPSWLPTTLAVPGDPSVPVDFIQIPVASCVRPSAVIQHQHVPGSFEAMVVMHQVFPICFTSVVHAAGCILLAACLREELASFIEHAKSHRLTLSIRCPLCSQGRVEFVFHGPLHTLPTFLGDALRRIREVYDGWLAVSGRQHIVLPDLYESARTSGAAHAVVQGTSMPPATQACILLERMGSNERPWGVGAIMEALSQLTLGDLKGLYMTTIRNPAASFAVVVGCFSTSQAESIGNSILSDFLSPLFGRHQPSVGWGRGLTPPSPLNLPSGHLLLLDFDVTAFTQDACSVVMQIMVHTGVGWSSEQLCVISALLADVSNAHVGPWMQRSTSGLVEAMCSSKATPKHGVVEFVASSDSLHPFTLVALLYAFLEALPTNVTVRAIEAALQQTKERHSVSASMFEGLTDEDRMGLTDAGGWWGTLPMRFLCPWTWGADSPAATQPAVVAQTLQSLAHEGAKEALLRVLSKINPTQPEPGCTVGVAVSPGRWLQEVKDWEEHHLMPATTADGGALHWRGLVACTIAARNEVDIALPSVPLTLVGNQAAFQATLSCDETVAPVY